MKSLFADRLPKPLSSKELQGWIKADLEKRAALEQPTPSDAFTAPKIEQPSDSIPGQIGAGVSSVLAKVTEQFPSQIKADIFRGFADAAEKGFFENLQNEENPSVLPGPGDVIGGLINNAGAAIFGKEDAQATAQEAQRKAIQASQDIARRYPQGTSAERFYKAVPDDPLYTWAGAVGTLKAIANEPEGAAQFSARMISEMAPALTGAAIIGYATKNKSLAAAFMGLNSYAMERYAEPVDFLISKGMDPADPASVNAFVKNSAILDEAEQSGITRGMIIGSIDFLSGRLAGATLAKNPVVNMAGQTVVQGTLGGAGEALGQAATRDEINWKDVTLEFLGEFAGAPLEVVTMANEYVKAKGGNKKEIDLEQVRLDAARGDPKAVATLKAYGMTEDQIANFVAKAKPKVIEETINGIQQYADTQQPTVEQRQAAIEETQRKLAETIGGVAPTVEVKLPSDKPTEPPKKKARGASKKAAATTPAPTPAKPATDAPTGAQPPSETGGATVQSDMPVTPLPEKQAERPAVTVVSQKKGGDQFEGVHTKVTLSNGETATLQRMTDGMKGWHWMEKPTYGSSMVGPDYTYIADNKKDAIQYVIDHFNEKATVDEAVQAGETTIQTPEFKNWFKQSAAVNPEGKPQVFFHGTGRDIKAFGNAKSASLAGEEGPFFLSPNPKFANQYAEMDLSAGGGGKDRKKGGNVMPVFASAQKPFDYDNVGHVEQVEAGVREGLANGTYTVKDLYSPKEYKRVTSTMGEMTPEKEQKLLDERLIQMTKALPTGSWAMLETPALQKEIRKGFDSFFVREATIKNLAVYSPNQIKSVFNRGTFNAEDPNIDAMAAPKERIVDGGAPVPNAVDKVSSLEEAFKFVKSQVFATGRDLKLALQAAVQAAAEGVDLTVQNTENQQHLARMVVRDALYALKSNSNAVGWYDKTVTKALKVLATIHPEIQTDPDAKFAFTFALAVTSNGLKVDKNFQLAEQAYQIFKKTGKMPTDIGIGTAADAINKSLGAFNELVDRFGKDDARALMMTHFTVAQLRKLGLGVTGEDATTVVRGAAFIGPKIGNGFFSNLNGVFDALTIDRWLMRTWGRWTGNLVSVRADKVAAKSAELTALIDQLTPEEKAAFTQATGVALDGKPEEIAMAIKAASTDPAIRAEMNKIGKPYGNDDQPVGDWLRRTGNGLWGYLDGQIEQPEQSQRQYIRDTFGAALKWLNANGYPDLTMADLQALLWYPEKRLYDAAKISDEADIEEGYTDDDAPDYANAAIGLAKEKGVSSEKIDNAVKNAELEYAAKVSTRGTGRGDAGPEEAGNQGGAARNDGGERKERSRLLKRWVFQEDRHRRIGDGGVRVFRGQSLGRNQALGRVKARFEPTGNFKKIAEASEIRVPSAFYELAPAGDEATAKFEEAVAKAEAAVANAKSDGAKAKAEARLEKAKADLDNAKNSHARLFSDAITASKNASDFGAAVYVYPTEDYAKMRLFLTDDKLNGFAIKPDGDIVSVFSSGGGAVHAMLELAVEQGGTKLDCFNTVLPKLYALSDFVEVGRDKWSDEYKPEGWDYGTFKDFNGGRPDVVYMEYRPQAVQSNEVVIEEDGNEEAILPRKSGAQLTGGKTRTGGIASTPTNTSYDATLTQIHQNFISLMNLVVRTGSVTAGGGQALGQHSKDNGVIRLKEARDFEVLTHEAGHALHSDRGAQLDAIINSALGSTELAALARYFYGGSLKNATKTKILREGFAEFFRLYMTNDAEAVNFAPNFYTQFENMLGNADPKLLDGIRTIRSQYKRLFDISSVAFGKSFLVSSVEGGFLQKARAGIEEMGLIGYLKYGLGFTAYRAYTGVVDKANVLTRIKTELQNIEEKNKGTVYDLKRFEDPRVLYEMMQRSGQVATDEIFHGVTDFYGRKNTTASMRDAIARLHDVDPTKKIPMDETLIEDFNNYLVAKTVLEDETNPDLLARKDKPTAPYNKADAQQIISELEAKHGVKLIEASEMIYDYLRGVWKKMYDAGLLDAEKYQDGLIRKNYVPLLRDMSGTATGPSAKQSALTSGEAKVVKQRGGSARDIIFPLESIMSITMGMEQSIANNRVKVALAQMADRAGRGSGAFIERIPDTQLKVIEAPILDVINQALSGTNLSTQDQDMVRMIFESVYDDAAKATVFRRQVKTPGPDGEHIMFFWENGKRKAFVVDDPNGLQVAEDLFAAMDGMGQENFGALVDVLALSSVAVRTGVTSWLDFLLVNYIRDQLSAWALTDVGYIPVFSGLKGMYHILTQSDTARDYLNAGGTMGGVNSAALEAIQTQRDVDILKRKGYSVQLFGSDKGYTGVIKALTHLSELMEGATRVGLFEKAFKRAKAEGLTDQDAMTEAAWIATDYINFSRHGSAKSARLAARVVPFLNAQVQGLDKMVRSMFGDDVAARKGTLFALKAYLKSSRSIDAMQNLTRVEKAQLKNGRKLWMKMAMIGMIGASLSLMFKGDPDYDEASPYLRSRYWVIPLGNGKVILIPKPFELAIVNNAIEAAIDSNGASRERFLDGLAQTLTPPVQNPLIKYVYEVATNYDTFKDRPLVPTWMQTLPPAQRAHAYTSNVAKKIGEAINVSPILVEHFITSVGASAGRDLLGMLDWTDPNRPAKGWDETAIIRRFIRETRKGGNTTTDFYAQMSQQNGEILMAGAGYKQYMDSQRVEQANAYLDGLNDEQKAWAILNYNWDAKYKRMHPGYRTNQIAEVMTGLKKELFLPSFKGADDQDIVLTAGQKAEVSEAINDILHREMRNYLVAMKTPGWQDKPILPVGPSYDMLREINPDVADLLDARIAKAKVYDFDIVMQNWPEVRQALTGDREYADLDSYLRDFGVRPSKRKSRD